MPLPTPTFRKVASMSFSLSLLPASRYLFETPGLDIYKASAVRAVFYTLRPFPTRSRTRAATTAYPNTVLPW